VADTENDRTERVLDHPEQWVTGDEPWTTAQRSYLHTLAREAGTDVPAEMTKAEASRLIDEMRERTNRG
jgi:hypothetical protein